MWVLIDGLPPDSAFRRGGKQWTQGDELAAVCCEITQTWLASQIGMWMKKGAKVPPIVPITHPDRPRQERKKKVVSIDQFARKFGGR